MSAKKRRRFRTRRQAPTLRPPRDLRELGRRFAATTATCIGVLFLVAGIGVQCVPSASQALGSYGSQALRVAGMGLLMAAWLVGRPLR